MNQLTIVMYHYVREIKDSAYPKIKGLEIAGFRRQLDYLIKNYNIVNAQDVISCTQGKTTLPSNACFLTFDDGYKDHVDFVLPELLARGITGAFFPPVKPVVEREILDVNRVHFVLASADDYSKLVNDLDLLSLDRGVTAAELVQYREKYAVPSRFDISEVMYVKYMLQHVLPESIRNDIASVLFNKYVGRPEKDFAEELYISVNDAKKLVDSGMYVGSHGYRHLWLNREDIDSQAAEIDKSLKFLDNIGTPMENWIMCYPYGAYNDETLSLLKERKCSVALTTKVGVAKVLENNALELSRFDTNDFPQ